MEFIRKTMICQFHYYYYYYYYYSDYDNVTQVIKFVTELCQ